MLRTMSRERLKVGASAIGGDFEIGWRAEHTPRLCNFDRGLFMGGGRSDLLSSNE